MRRKRMMSRAQILTTAKKADDGKVSVEEAAKFLKMSPRRVRAIINPECNCVIKKRRQKKKPIPDRNCFYCNGTGHIKQRLRAGRRDGNKYKGYRIDPNDLFEYDSHRKPTGRPPGSTLS
jgi:hypothetical protein